MIEKIIIDRCELKKCYTENRTPILICSEQMEQEPDDVDLNRVMLEILMGVREEQIHNKGEPAA